MYAINVMLWAAAGYLPAEYCFPTLSLRYYLIKTSGILMKTKSWRRQCIQSMRFADRPAVRPVGCY